MLRTLIIVIFIISFFILSILLIPITYLISKINLRLSRTISYKIVRFVCNVVTFVSGAKINVSGLDNIPDGPVLFIGNHNSLLDIPISFHKIAHKELVFISKIEMKKVPFINAWLRLIGSLYLDRDNIKEGLKTILKGIDELKNGYSIFVFPEGTRSKDGKMLPFKEGTMKLAEKSGAPIVPVVFTHTSDLFERQMPRLKKAKITMVFGKPIYVKDLAPEDKKFTAKYVQAIMQKTLDEI
ncbi:MAG: hypothetical protein K0R15_1930, partial [Clostridiales bacterium]|jgi:1-acyl-sn-glycerol-3-phosphate acyltransferase|nr:hypothetical protein [Clostridiales bacterium]